VEIDQWTDLPDDISQHCFAVAKRIGEAQKQALHCDRVALIIAGFEVPHCHLHVIPAATIADISFDNAATSVDFDDLAAVAANISAVLN
jgi:histidine triad (HIT) family protein